LRITICRRQSDKDESSEEGPTTDRKEMRVEDHETSKDMTKQIKERVGSKAVIDK